MKDRSVGSRIRERRMALKIRQAELASQVGISASYLNLIEHDKRRIGGKLVVDIAGALGVEATLLSEGAEAALISALREAANVVTNVAPELERIEEFAARFPGWANVIRAQHQTGLKLERTVETLSDRLAHDPELAAAMHEVLSMVTAVHATAGILHENRELEPEWRARFHRNLSEDSQRLADSSQLLVNFLDGAQDAETRMASPRDELHSFLENAGYFFPQLEKGDDIEAIVTGSELLHSKGAHYLAREVLADYAINAKSMPLEAFEAAHVDTNGDVAALAEIFSVSLAAVMRRLAFLPKPILNQDYGLVKCDMAGTMIYRKELKGFSLPRYSSACPRWPLFRALQRPGQPLVQIVEFAAREMEQFECFAVSEPQGRPQFGQDTTFTATMLITPNAERKPPEAQVGAACRICSVETCLSRREPSILVDGI
ncbi:short-chain fatty acyl-CoA regulator family protein [Cognatishimia sp.]|uniref:short-chain fatty acyl-CoA regulator family protein n=1 Tax=Cognatishimia sp. TaxID=2211648 RepID=UPI003511122B